MLRCKTDSENERASGGPVSSVTRQFDGREMIGAGSSDKKGTKTKSIVFAAVLVFAAIKARNVLQQGETASFCFEGAFCDAFMCIGQPFACGAGVAHAAPSRQ